MARWTALQVCATTTDKVAPTGAFGEEMLRLLGFCLVLAFATVACSSSDSADAGAVQGTAGTPAVAPPPAAGSGGSIATGASGSPAADTGDVPCGVATVLKQHCVRCHGNMLREGAPVTLTEAAHFQKDNGGQTVGAAVLARVRSAERPMPPLPSAKLSEAEIGTLEAWIGPGSKVTHPGCSVDTTPAAPAAGSGGSGVVIVPAGGTGAPPTGPTAPSDETSNWATFGADLHNSRNNPAEKILSVESVKTLKEKFTFMGPSTTSTAAVVDGTIYLPGWDGKVYALRLEDGMPVWTATLPDLIDSSPTVTDKQVFVSDDNGSVHALDRATGNKQWSTPVDMHAEAHLWSSPVFIPDANLIVVGVASGEEAVRAMEWTFRGSVVALDATTGAQKWKFVTADPAKGAGPGVAVWATAAVDTKRKALYIGTGNNYAEPSSELCDSMLAINYETGALVWSKQFTAQDVFTIYGGATGPDFDIGSSANLFSVDGADFVGIGVKDGTYYALDRDSGTVKWMSMITGGGPLGGVISASAYANGMIFVASNDMLTMQTTTVGISAKDGTIAWRHNAPNMTYGGIAHANGVVYFGTNAGSVYALDGANGTMLWVDQTPNMAPIGGGPTVTQGRLLVPWGYRWTLREGVNGAGGLTVYGL